MDDHEQLPVERPWPEREDGTTAAAGGTADERPWQSEATLGGDSFPDPASPRLSPLAAPPPTPWLSAPAVTPAPPRASGSRGGGTFGVALLAALLSAILTVTASFVAFRVLTPELTPAAAPTPSLAASVGPSAIPTVAPTATAGAVVPAPDSSSATVVATARVLPAVVTITTQAAARRGTVEGTGSGFVFDASGWILTNRHVVSGASSITVTLNDGRTLPGQVYGVSSTNDLAVVKVDATGLPAAAIGDSSGLALGQSVIVIGSPLGDYPGSVSTGVVSGLGRAIDITGVERLTNLIQTDAAVNPGNSGGPMVDLGGRVVGVATATSAAQGISFAIPIGDAQQVMRLALAGQPIP